MKACSLIAITMPLIAAIALPVQAGRLAAGPYTTENGGDELICTMMYLGKDTRLFPATIDVKRSDIHGFASRKSLSSSRTKFSRRELCSNQGGGSGCDPVICVFTFPDYIPEKDIAATMCMKAEYDSPDISVITSCLQAN